MSFSLSIAVRKGTPSAPLQKCGLALVICMYSSKVGVAVQPICTGVWQVMAAEQRAFQAVREKVLPAEPMRMQRSRMPGRLLMETCLLPANTRCSYTCRGEVPGICQQALALN